MFINDFCNEMLDKQEFMYSLIKNKYKLLNTTMSILQN